MKLTLEKQIPLVLGIAVLLLAVIIFFAVRSSNSLNESLKLEKHTQEVLLQLDETLLLSLDAETGARGFLITGDESYLEPFTNADGKISGSLTKLRLLIADNPQQAERLVKLSDSLNQRFAVLRKTVELRRANSLEEVRQQIAGQLGANRGKNLMDDFRSTVSRMKGEEQNLLIVREADLNESLTNTSRMLFFSSIFGIIALVLANFAIFREIKKRAAAENELKILNKNLESRVAERTRELSDKNVEFEDQIKRREHAEERRRVALDAGGLGTWKLNLDGSDGELDERTLAVFGLDGEDFDGSSRKAFSRVIEEDAPRVDAEFRKSVVEKINFDAEFRIRNSQGEIRWNNCTGQPQFGADGSVTHVVGFCRDITESKENELALRDSESFVRGILDSLPAHISVLDRDGKIIAVNQAWRNYAAANCLEEQQLDSTDIGQNYVRVCETSAAFEEDTQVVVEQMRAVLNGMLKGFSFEYPCHSPTEERWFILQANAMPQGAVISHFDISDRKRAETELKNSEEFNRSIFENSPDCVKVLNLDGTLYTMNSNGLCVMEIDDFSEFAGTQWTNFWEGEERGKVRQAIEKARKGGTAHFEGFSKTGKGTLKYWDVTVAPIFDGSGNPLRLISTSRDITERREVEAERERLLKNEQEARRDAEIANRLRDEFLATVSHELRAPLNSILGWGRLLQKGQLDEMTTEKAIGTIVRNAESQNRLIEDLLDVSRIISGKLRLEVMTIKPINIVESALETVRPAAEAKGIKIEVKGDADISHISGDPNRLQQVIWNLLSNAIKFTPPEGEVRLEIERTDDFVEVRVK
ncbi:MAG: CHASE3 domain-containing protein, partial [Acidobacteriota bacterium]|nr:CHASE3 domain-containing protein [Acidobacteriota bacterium]